jgi:hypothetical protein
MRSIFGKVSTFFIIAAAVEDVQAALSDNMAYSAKLAEARDACLDASGKLGGISGLMGWSQWLGLGGGVVGGVAVGSGIMKMGADKDIKDNYSKAQMAEWESQQTSQESMNEEISTVKSANLTVVAVPSDDNGEIALPRAAQSTAAITVSGAANIPALSDTDLETDDAMATAQNNLSKVLNKLSESSINSGESSMIASDPSISSNTTASNPSISSNAATMTASKSTITDCSLFTTDADKEACVAGQKKSETLGNVRAFTAAGATALSAGSAITGGMAVKAIDDASKAVATCADAALGLSAFRMQLDSDDEADGTAVRLDSIARECKDFEGDNLGKMKNLLVGASISGGVGAAAGVAGTILSFQNKGAYQATGDEYLEDLGEGVDGKLPKKSATSAKETAANVLNGVAAAGSGVAGALAAVSNNGMMKARFKRTTDRIAKCISMLDK